MTDLSGLIFPKDLSSQILNDLAGRYAKSGPPFFYTIDETRRVPDRSFESYGEEPKRFTWANLSDEYDWEQCL